MQHELGDADLGDDDVRDRHDDLVEQSQKWIQQCFVEAVRRKGIDENRVRPVLEAYTKAYSVDVRGTVEARTQMAEYSILTLTDALKTASKDALRRRQHLLFLELVSDVMMPFYEEHAQIGYLRGRLDTATRFKVPSLKGDEGLLQQTLNAGDLALMGISIDWSEDSSRRSSLRNRGELDPLSASRDALTAVHGGDAGVAGFVHTAAKRRKDLLKREVMQPLLQAGTTRPDDVDRRWDKDMGFEPGTFEPYRKRGGRQLGYDLKASEPEETLLPELTIPTMVKDAVLPLQACARRHTFLPCAFATLALICRPSRVGEAAQLEERAD